MAKPEMINVTTRFENMFGLVKQEFRGSMFTIDRVLYSSTNHLWSIYDMSTTDPKGYAQRIIKITKNDAPYIITVPNLLTANMFPTYHPDHKKYHALPDYVKRGFNELCGLKTRQRD